MTRIHTDSPYYRIGKEAELLIKKAEELQCLITLADQGEGSDSDIVSKMEFINLSTTVLTDEIREVTGMPVGEEEEETAKEIYWWSAPKGYNLDEACAWAKGFNKALTE